VPYGSTKELPANVRSKLKGKKLRQWMHVWNSSFARHQSESIAFAEAWATVEKADGFGKANVMNDFQFFLPIAKLDQEKRTVSGYASTPKKDSDGEIVTLGAIKTALPDYMAWGNIREMHKLSAVGTAEEANVDTKGLFLTAKIVDDSAWKKCLEGVYKGFSIGGRKLAKEGDTITAIELTEISVVDRPANPDAKFSLAKSAKDRDDEPGYLVKIREKVSPEGKALAKMAKIVSSLAKAGPPAAHDGFSLPAPKAAKKADVISPKDQRDDENVTRKTDEKCEKHGVANCEKCALEKNEIDNKKPVVLPVKSGKKAKKLAKQQLALALGISGDSFLSLKKAKVPSEAGQEELNKGMGAVGNLAYCFDSIRSAQRSLIMEAQREGGDMKDKALAKELGSIASQLAKVMATKAEHEGSEAEDLSDADDQFLTTLLGENFDMDKVNDTTALTKTGDGLEDVLRNMLAKAAQPTRAQRMAMASDNVKKSRKACKMAKQSIEEAHKMHKAAYLNKAAKKPKDDNDGDEFDHAGAMEKLQKAYQELDKARTFGKAATTQLAKMAGRAGQRGQETGDGNSFYQVPAGVKDLTTSDLATASPGGDGSGSAPPLYPIDGQPYPGKAAPTSDLAKYSKNGQISADVAELIMAKAKSEGELEALRRLPAASVSGGKRPYNFDVTRVTGAAGNNSDTLNKALFDGVDPIALGSGDENAHTAASAKVIGNFLTSGHFGKSVFDPSFKGAAGQGR
jgi:phage head maturation protease/cation transport regulator ChaB